MTLKQKGDTMYIDGEVVASIIERLRDSESDMNFAMNDKLNTDSYLRRSRASLTHIREYLEKCKEYQDMLRPLASKIMRQS